MQLAAAVCAAPLAVAAFPGSDRLSIRASTAPLPAEIPFQFGFSALTVAAREPIVLPDTHLDSRAADNAVLGPPWFARFYAGVPFLTSDGRVLGALEIYDHVPRQLEPWQMDGLLRLARIVTGTIESWSAQRERETRRARTLAALAGGLAAELKRSEAGIGATSRAADLARQLLAVAGHRSLRPQPIDLNALVTGLSRSRPAEEAAGAWSLALDPAAGEVYGDEERIGRAIRGLAARAAGLRREPVPIATRDVVVPGPPADASLLPPGRYVMVTIGAPPPGAEAEISAWFEEPRAGDIAEVSGLMVESGGRLGFRRDPAGGPAYCLALPRILPT